MGLDHVRRAGVRRPGFGPGRGGQGAPAAVVLRVKSDNSQSFEPAVDFDPAQNKFVPRMLEFGQDDLFLILFGSGVRFRNLTAPAVATLGNQFSIATYAGPQGPLIGLDQINLPLPRGLAGMGEITVIVSVDGRNTNDVRVAFK